MQPPLSEHPSPRPAMWHSQEAWKQNAEKTVRVLLGFLWSSSGVPFALLSRSSQVPLGFLSGSSCGLSYGSSQVLVGFLSNSSLVPLLGFLWCSSRIILEEFLWGNFSRVPLGSLWGSFGTFLWRWFQVLVEFLPSAFQFSLKFLGSSPPTPRGFPRSFSKVPLHLISGSCCILKYVRLGLVPLRFLV